MKHLSLANAPATAWLVLAFLLTRAIPAPLAAAPAPNPQVRHYAPDREVQLLHLRLDVTPDFQARSVQGTATLSFKPIFRALRELKLDANDLRVTQVEASQPVQGHNSTAEQLVVTFKEPVPVDTIVNLTIQYSAEPKQGLYFRTPEMGYRNGDTHLFSQGEEILARHWYPCIDTPNAMFTSEVICRVPDGMTVISNGRLVSEDLDAASGLRRFHWSQEQPHANYLITLVAGYFGKLEDRYRDIPIAFLTPPSEIAQAATSFRNTKDMLAFFEEEIGVAYPWPKYYQICVNDFVAGGMENTSATTLTDGTLFTPDTENLQDSDGLVAHELAHQWFGDLVTCKDWSHIWLNEGFATFYETLYQGHKDGPDAMLNELYEQSRLIVGNPGEVRSIVRRDYEQPGDMFGYLSYQKGGWVVHMLRQQLGPDAFRKCIRTYLERHRHGNVVTEDLRRIIEEYSGRTYDQFFDQWVYHGGFPRLEVRYSWDETKRLARLTVRQTQKTGPDTLLFNVPLAIRFKYQSGVEDREIQITQTDEDFYFPLAEKPRLVRLDPHFSLLADIVFSVPGEMLKLQLQDQDDFIGRRLAVAEYAKRRDGEAVAQLRAVLQSDPREAIRRQASAALGAMQSDEAFRALLDSTTQEDARVRRQVVEDVGRYYRAEARAFAEKVVGSEKNPDIRATAIGTLAAYGGPEIRQMLLDGLQTASYRNRIADAAVRAMRDQADPNYIKPIFEALQSNGSRFGSHSYGQALGALAWLARDQENKDQVRELLLESLEDPRRPVRMAAISGLGRLGDRRAIPALQKIASSSRQNRELSAADAALAELRKDVKPGEELGSLRKEILDLQNANRELKEQFEEIRKQFEAMKPPATATATNEPAKQP